MITFFSQNQHSLTYLQAQGEQMLQLMGCMPYDANTGRGDAAAKAEGVLPADTVASAIMRLKQHQQLENPLPVPMMAPAPACLTGHANPVLAQEPQDSLSVRILPLLELLQGALNAGQPVLWRHATCR